MSVTSWLKYHRFRKMRNAIGRAQGFGDCLRCGDTWNWAESHSTPITDSRAMFPLCERCWSSLTPETRVRYYQDLWWRWLEDVEKPLAWRDPQTLEKYKDQLFEDYPLIIAAVRNGL